MGRYERYVAGNLTEMWSPVHKPKCSTNTIAIEIQLGASYKYKYNCNRNTVVCVP